MSIDFAELDFPSFFDGCWIEENLGKNINIENGMCSFQFTKNCPLSRTKNLISLTFHDSIYWLLSATKSTLSWSDGGVWVRKSEVERRLLCARLRDIAGKWSDKGEFESIDVSVKGVVRFRNDKQTWILRKTDKTFKIERQNENFIAVVISSNGNRLVWKDLGVWIREDPEYKESEVTLSVIYQHLSDLSVSFPDLDLGPLKPSTRISELKHILVDEANITLKEEIFSSQIHIIHQGCCVADESHTLISSGITNGSTIWVLVVPIKCEELASPRQPKTTISRTRSSTWPSLKDILSSTRSSKGMCWKRKSGTLSPKDSTPTTPNSVSYICKFGSIQDSCLQSCSDEDYRNESILMFDEKECGSTPKTVSVEPNLLRRRSISKWSDHKLSSMEQDMNIHLKDLQMNKELTSACDLDTLDLSVFDGEWAEIKRKQVINVSASKGVVDVAQTCRCPFYRHPKTSRIILEWNDDVLYMTKVTRCLREVCWSNGDVWTRKSDANNNEDKKVTINELQGQWLRGRAKDQQCEIRGNVVNLPKTKGCPLLKDEKGFHIVYLKKRHTIDQVSADKQRIFWDNNDVWYRDSNMNFDHKLGFPRSSFDPLSAAKENADAQRSRTLSFGQLITSKLSAFTRRARSNA